jgi:hypothetical protein
MLLEFAMNLFPGYNTGCNAAGEQDLEVTHGRRRAGGIPQSFDVSIFCWAIAMHIIMSAKKNERLAA